MENDRAVARALYSKLLALYPRAFRERLGESMEQTFNDLWRERREADGRVYRFMLWTFAETAVGIIRERLLAIFHSPRKSSYRAAFIGCVLCLPAALLYAHLLLDRALPFGQAVPNDRPGVIGPTVLSLLVLLPGIAAIINLAPIRRTTRAGGHILAHPINMLIIVAVLISVAGLAGGMAVDQYPCWTGEPNCD